MGVLDNLVEKNTYPIVFIGSGMSMRYFKNFPNWDGLIKTIWTKAFQGKDDDYYMFMNQLRLEIQEEYPDATESYLSYQLNISASSVIEKKFNEAYISGEIIIENYSNKDYFETGVSPFKKEISNIFENLKIRDEKIEEYEIYKKFLSKAKIILTTNYDEVVENAYNSIVSSNPIDTYVGQEGFLRENVGYAELYKIHGSIRNPSSIVITNDDYKLFKKNSILISAKIISSLINSPIIFLGYSLTDENIRSIIRDFSGSLNKEDSISASERIILVERQEGVNRLSESKIMEKDLGIELTQIITDNFSLLFKTINEINEGVSSAFINQYSKLFKKLIIERGKEGTLETLLVSPNELGELEKNEQLRKNAAVVMADSAVVYAYPLLIDYFISYFQGDKLITDVGLHYIASQLPKTNIPFWWYVDNLDLDRSSLNANEKDKIKSRIVRFSDLEEQIGKINKYNKIEVHSEQDLEKLNYPEKKKTDIVSFNINNLDEEFVRRFILDSLSTLKEKNEFKIDTPLRRLCVLYDIKYIKN